jgi:tetratricopeptide (TPR) repeat protein
VGVLWGQAKQSPQELLKEAVTLHQQGKLDEAIRDYELFLDMYPEAAGVRSNLGAALAGTGRYSLAIEQYKRALETKPDLAARLNLAIAYYKTDRLKEAVVELEKVHAADPSNAQALLLLATCDLRMGANKKVIELLTPARDTNASDRAVAYLLGTALARDGQVEQARAAINPILSGGDSAEAHMLLGTAKFAAHEYAPAVADLAKAVEMNPNLPDVYAYYGLALFVTGDLEGSRKAFQEELKHDPNNFDANLRLGTMLRQEQKYDEAQRYFQRALLVRPDDPATRYQIALVDLALDRQEQARDELGALVRESPAFTEAHVSLATIYYREKRKDDGDRERALVQKLNAERQSQQPAAKETK